MLKNNGNATQCNAMEMAMAIQYNAMEMAMALQCHLNRLIWWQIVNFECDELTTSQNVVVVQKMLYFDLD